MSVPEVVVGAEPGLRILWGCATQAEPAGKIRSTLDIELGHGVISVQKDTVGTGESWKVVLDGASGPMVPFVVMRNFTAIVEKDADTGLYVGYLPGWPGAHSQGSTLDELHLNLEEVIAMLLEDGEPRLTPSSSASVEGAAGIS